jgi:hypothetical protein
VQIETFMVGGKRVSLHTSVLEEKATGEEEEEVVVAAVVVVAAAAATAGPATRCLSIDLLAVFTLAHCATFLAVSSLGAPLRLPACLPACLQPAI